MSIRYVKNGEDIYKRPEQLEEMLHIARRLSEDFQFCRVDLYLVKGKVYFGEITFYPWTGYVQCTPDKFDFVLGDLWC